MASPANPTVLHVLCVLILVLRVSASGTVIHYPPTATNINNLTYALTGGGAPGIFNSSKTPDRFYGQYNWCNMPHVRAREYKKPPMSYTLQYVEVIQRHHKRTPYSSNVFPVEDVEWNCNGSGPLHGLKSSKGISALVPQIQWEASIDTQNPFTSTVSPGFVGSNCQFPQITETGLEDAIVHGADIRDVYALPLHLPLHFDSSVARIRVTNNVITSQVASGLAKGLFPASFASSISVQIQSSSFDSLEPTYSCANADKLKNIITSTPEWNEHLSASKVIFDQLDNVSGVAGDDGGWHASFDHYYDNLSGKQCHDKHLPCKSNDPTLCVSQDLADAVYRLGNWEYSYRFRDDPKSTEFAALRYGAWILELKAHLKARMDGTSTIRYSHNIAHDGSISLLLSFLQIQRMVWPGMGSEVAFELYSTSSRTTPAWFVRVLWGGQPMETSTPLGVLDMVPVEKFFAYIDEVVGTGSDLLKACTT